jgi:hypothetical protein
LNGKPRVLPVFHILPVLRVLNLMQKDRSYI